MRFAGFTEESRVRAMMRAFKDQPVFGPRNTVNRPKNEAVLHFAGGDYGGGTPVSIVDKYFRAISEEKVVRNAKSLLKAAVGLMTYQYTLDESKLRELVEESSSYLENDNQYSQIRWHDVIVLLLIIHIFNPGSPHHNYAAQHLARLSTVNPQISKYFATFTDKTQ